MSLEDSARPECGDREVSDNARSPEGCGDIESIRQSIAAISPVLRNDALYHYVGKRAEADLRAPLFAVLGRIGLSAPVRVSALSEVLGLDTSTLSRYVASLEQRGLVCRTRDSTDRRASFLELSEDGVKWFMVLHHEWIRVLKETMSDWTIEDISTFARLFGSFAGRLGSVDVEARH
jgi:DNA-binding MarR family transcriptional regulator